MAIEDIIGQTAISCIPEEAVYHAAGLARAEFEQFWQGLSDFIFLEYHILVKIEVHEQHSSLCPDKL